MTLKVMKLEQWMQSELWDNHYFPECELVFNRDGQYYDPKTKKCWFEVNGRARVISHNDFLYTLALLNHRPLREVERDAINVLMQHNLAPKSLRKLLLIDNDVRELRQSGREAILYRNRFLNRFKEKIK